MQEKHEELLPFVTTGFVILLGILFTLNEIRVSYVERTRMLRNIESCEKELAKYKEEHAQGSTVF